MAQSLSLYYSSYHGYIHQGVRSLGLTGVGFLDRLSLFLEYLESPCPNQKTQESVLNSVFSSI